MNRFRVLTAAAAAAALLGGGAAYAATSHASSAQQACPAGPAPIVGTWRMTIDPVAFVIKGKKVDPPPFHTLVSFQEGGTMTDANSGTPGAPWLAPLRLTGYTNALGSWRMAQGVVHFTFEGFLTSGGKFAAKEHISGWATVTRNCLVQNGQAVAQYSSDSADTFATKTNVLGPPLVVKTYGTRLQP